MGNTKVYFVTKKFQNLCEELEGEAQTAIGLKLPELTTDEADFICPPITVWQENDIYASPGDYDNEDVPMLEKMVEFGFLRN